MYNDVMWAECPKFLFFATTSCLLGQFNRLSKCKNHNTKPSNVLFKGLNMKCEAKLKDSSRTPDKI